MAIITKRPFPIGILETLNWQTDKDFTLKILVRGSQPWTEEDLKKALDFPVKVYEQKLYYSTGTRYATALALNEILTHIESEYVFFTEDNSVINPRSVEILRGYAQKDMVVTGFNRIVRTPWAPDIDYPDFKDEFEGKSREYPIETNFSEPLWISNIICVYPMEAFRRVNGFDCAYDGQWGVLEYDLRDRLVRAGYKLGLVKNVCVYMFKHKSHYEESDDPPLSEELCVYNKETGVRDYSIKLCRSWGGSTQYHKWSIDHGIIEAPFGLKQVEALLEG